MSTQNLAPRIRTYHTHLPSPLPQSPSFQLHVTRLTDTLFIWVGAAPPTPVSLQEMRLKAAAAAAAGGDSDSGAAAPGAEENERSIAALSLHDGEEEGEDVGGARGDGERRVTVDWAVSMPVRPNMPPVSTPVFRSATADLAEPMSQRIARKFPSNQVHLSLSLPSTLTAPSGPSLDPFASRTLLMMEKELSKWIGELLEAEKNS